MGFANCFKSRMVFRNKRVASRVTVARARRVGPAAVDELLDHIRRVRGQARPAAPQADEGGDEASDEPTDAGDEASNVVADEVDEDDDETDVCLVSSADSVGRLRKLPAVMRRDNVRAEWLAALPALAAAFRARTPPADEGGGTAVVVAAAAARALPKLPVRA